MQEFLSLEAILLMALIGLALLNMLFIFLKKPKIPFDFAKFSQDSENQFLLFNANLEKLERTLTKEFSLNREENSKIATTQRQELTNSLNTFNEAFIANTDRQNRQIKESFGDFANKLQESNRFAQERIEQLRESVAQQLQQIREDNSKQLEEMRKTVDEKLQKTLNARLNESFTRVGEQLVSVQQGLGEMKSLASDVGGLKKVLSNVKTRGTMGEVQLGMLLEQILAPIQYEQNVQTKPKSGKSVEYAIKLPGRDDENSHIWLPIDSKFPMDIYEKLQEAYEIGEQEGIKQAQKNLANKIKSMAGDIRDKYIEAPSTTDFGIMFLPIEGIYAEVVRDSSLMLLLQKEYKTIVTGPTSLAAILNSLQVGFKTLAIQKRGSEVWQVLAETKKEFIKFENLLDKAHSNINDGLNKLDEIMGTRTRAIIRKLKSVDILEPQETNLKINLLDSDN